jgi:hypothetical protein
MSEDGCWSDWPLSPCSGHGQCQATNDTNLINVIGNGVTTVDGSVAYYCECDAGWSANAGGDFIDSRWHDCGHYNDAVFAIRLIQLCLAVISMTFAVYKLLRYCHAHRWQPRAAAQHHHIAINVAGIDKPQQQHDNHDGSTNLTCKEWANGWFQDLIHVFPFRMRFNRILSGGFMMLSGAQMLAGKRVAQDIGKFLSKHLLCAMQTSNDRSTNNNRSINNGIAWYRRIWIRSH